MHEPGLDELLRALAHSDRRLFLRSCRDGPLSAGELVALSSLTAATVSEHLKVLRKTGLLVADRDGKKWLYRTDPDAVERVMVWTRAEIGAGEGTPGRRPDGGVRTQFSAPGVVRGAGRTGGEDEEY